MATVGEDPASPSSPSRSATALTADHVAPAPTWATRACASIRTVFQSGSVHQHPIGFDRRARAVPAGLYCDPHVALRGPLHGLGDLLGAARVSHHNRTLHHRGVVRGGRGPVWNAARL